MEKKYRPDKTVETTLRKKTPTSKTVVIACFILGWQCKRSGWVVHS
jgi:hypothetical protein